MSKNHAIFKRSPKLEFSSNFKVFYVVLWGKDWSTKLLSLIFKIFVLQKKYFFSKLTFFENFDFFLRFQKSPKNGIYVLYHYIVHVHTKFQPGIIFGSHFITLKRCPSDGSMVPSPTH